MKLEYIKETREQILKEKEDTSYEIDKLEKLEVAYVDKTIAIEFKLLLTLINGKVLNAITNTTSSQRCLICGATPMQVLKINDFQVIEFLLKNKNSLQHGVSPLHARIRFFECVIHIGYRIKREKWQVKERDKEDFLSRKKEVQKLFWDRLALYVDKLKSGGSGSTNDAKTARHTFQNLELFAEITGVDINLLTNFKILLITICNQFQINLEKF